MRCPFCASPRAALPDCLACGMSLLGVDPASVQHTLRDLEPTRYDPVVVQAERIADLLTWRADRADRADKAGKADSGVDEVLTDSSVAANIPCPNCGRGLGLGPVCDFCGATRMVAREAPDPDSHACCSQCGTPNSFSRALCKSCGTRLEA